MPRLSKNKQNAMQKLILSFLFFFSFLTTFSQMTVTGVILDSASKEPLVSASVFCQNTTSGTYSNKQGEFSLSLKSSGKYDLIVSYTGYQTQTIRLGDSTHFQILMAKEDKSMGEVVIKSSSEVPDGWTKYGNFFTQNFIGATPNAANTTILNPEVLKFYFSKRNNRLKVLADSVLVIENKALGYQIRYQLDSFVYYYNTELNSYRGYCLFSEMEGSDSLKNIWANARKNAYDGSKLHFMRSYYDSTIQQDGWIIDMLDENDDKKFNKIKNVYDTSYYNGVVNMKDSLGLDSVMYSIPDGTFEVEIFFPRKISVTYTKKWPEKEYLKKMKLPKNIPYQISYIEIKDWIAITENGFYYEQKNWINQGYWSWKNLADLLPYDYEPD